MIVTIVIREVNGSFGDSLYLAALLNNLLFQSTVEKRKNKQVKEIVSLGQGISGSACLKQVRTCRYK